MTTAIKYQVRTKHAGRNNSFRLAAIAIAVWGCLNTAAFAEPNNGQGPNPPIGSAQLAPPTGPGGGPGGPCNPPPLPPGLLLPSHARGVLRETCGANLRGVANKPIEVILRVKQQSMICDINNIPPTSSHDALVATGETAADGSFNVEFFANDGGISADMVLLELKVRIIVYDELGGTEIWRTAYYSQDAAQTFNVNEDVTVSCLTEGTRINVKSPNGDNSFDAEVFVNGKLHPQRTNANGQLTIFPAVPVNSTIVARAMVFESQSKRTSHSQGSNQNWKYRAYITSIPLKYDGNGDNVRFEPTRVVDPNGAFELHLNRQAAYLGLHLVASLEWDATPAELNSFDSKMKSASTFLYNATDGQMLIERVDVYDEKNNWDEADAQVNTNASLRANVDWPLGGFWEEEDRWFNRNSWMHMSRRNVDNVYIHEFGHYGMILGDEYEDDEDTHCAVGIGSGSPVFDVNKDKAACMMYHQFECPKICSNHGDNRHIKGTNQGDEDCWSEIKRHFTGEAPGPNGNPRWYLQTPVDRGVIVGKVPGLPVSDWQTIVEINDFNNNNVCAPKEFTWVNNNGFAEGAKVYSTYPNGYTMIQGYTDATGQFAKGLKTVAGLHIGDTITAIGTKYNPRKTDFIKTRVITDADCISGTIVLSVAPGQTPPTQESQMVETENLPFSLAAQLETTATLGEAIIRVRADADLAEPPIVRLSIDNETSPRVVTMSLDAAGADYVGLATNVPERFGALVHAQATATDGAKSEYVGSVAIAAAPHDEDSQVASSDGIVQIELAAGTFAEPTRISIGDSVAPLPDELDGRIHYGPVNLSAARVDLAADATLRFVMPFDTEQELLEQIDPARLFILAYDDATNTWKEIESTYNHGRLAFESTIANLGTFMLVESGNAAGPGGSDENPGESPAELAPSADCGTGAGECGVGMASASPLMLAWVGVRRRNRRTRQVRERR